MLEDAEYGIYWVHSVYFDFRFRFFQAEARRSEEGEVKYFSEIGRHLLFCNAPIFSDLAVTLSRNADYRRWHSIDFFARNLYSLSLLSFFNQVHGQKSRDFCAPSHDLFLIVFTYYRPPVKSGCSLHQSAGIFTGSESVQLWGPFYFEATFSEESYHHNYQC